MEAIQRSDGPFFGGEAMTIGDGNRHDNSERGMVALSERQIPSLPIAPLPFARAWKRDVEIEDEFKASTGCRRSFGIIEEWALSLERKG